VAHDSGFRQGAHDVTHRDPRPPRGTKASRKFDDRLARRFHEHEKAQESRTGDEGRND
jgi:hypothetical protein